METLTLQDQNKQTFWGKVLSKPTLEETKDGKFSFFIFKFEITRPFFKGGKTYNEATTLKCIAFKEKAEDLNMTLEIGHKVWIKGYFKNDKDKSLTFVVGDYGKL